MPKASNGKRKTTSTKKRTSTDKSRQQKAKKASQQKAYIAGVCLLIAALIFGGFIYISSSGVVGGFIHAVLFGVWGLGAMVLPFILLALGIYTFVKKSGKNLIVKSIFLFFALVFFCAILAQFSLQIVEPTNAIECYKAGQTGTGGGLIGGGLYLLLSQLTGDVVCAILLMILFIVSLTLTTRFSAIRFLSGLWQGLRENREQIEPNYEKSYETGKKVGQKSAHIAQKARLHTLPRKVSVDIPLTDEEEEHIKKAPFEEEEEAARAQKSFDKIKKADQSLKETIENFPVYGLTNEKVKTPETKEPASKPSEPLPYSGTFIKQEDSIAAEPEVSKPLTQESDSPSNWEETFKSDEELKKIASDASLPLSPESFSPLSASKSDLEEPFEEDRQELNEPENVMTFDLSEEFDADDFDSVNSEETDISSQASAPLSTAQKLNYPPAPGVVGNITDAEHEKNQFLFEETQHAEENHLPQKPIMLPYTYPKLDFLTPPRADKTAFYESEIRENVQKLVQTLDSFHVKVKPLQASRGPSVTRYELQPGPGVKVSKITGLADDIALNLAATSVRIEAPIPGKAAIGIEVPNKNVSIVSLREVIESEAFESSYSKLSVALGKDIAGNPVIGDIAKMPHVLIAGATGSGKSVCINTLITSLLYKSNPNEVKFIMIDPKVVELGIYNGIPHLLVPVVTDPAKAAGSLNWAVQEMTRRYGLFAENNVRDMKGYNEYITQKFGEEYRMPNIVIIIDELADLMMVAPNDVEDAICRLAQMARAAGMHLVIATQRPSVDVITGIIKANIPSRIAFAVSSQIDSRTILDMAGAEKLLGKGDMLYYPSGASKPKRLQGAFVSDKEIEQIVEFIKSSSEANYDEDIVDSMEHVMLNDKKSAKGDAPDGDDADELLPQAIEIAVDLGQISTSFIQRRLKVGYARAGRIIDQMEERGIISGFEGSKPRNVLISKEQWMQMHSQE